MLFGVVGQVSQRVIFFGVGGYSQMGTGKGQISILGRGKLDNAM